MNGSVHAFFSGARSNMLPRSIPPGGEGEERRPPKDGTLPPNRICNENESAYKFRGGAVFPSPGLVRHPRQQITWNSCPREGKMNVSGGNGGQMPGEKRGRW